MYNNAQRYMYAHYNVICTLYNCLVHYVRHCDNIHVLIVTVCVLYILQL